MKVTHLSQPKPFIWIDVILLWTVLEMIMLPTYTDGFLLECRMMRLSTPTHLFQQSHHDSDDVKYNVDTSSSSPSLSSLPSPPASPAPSSSISDVVQGLHGGKYQFASAGLNLQGQQFAEQGYGSSNIIEEEERQHESRMFTEDLPKWASTMQAMEPPVDSTAMGRLIISNESPVSVIIANDERSWERYYAFLRTPSGTSPDAAAMIDSVVQIQPRVGQLAPRGSPSDQYSDSATVQISIASGVSSASLVNQDIYLVVGTEAERWWYNIIVE